MSREIKFRAVVSAEFVGEDKPAIVTAENDQHFSMCSSFDRAGLVDPNMDWVEEGHYIVEQYTGLKDCNGVEIYEGDIVQLVAQGPGCQEGKGEVKMVDACWSIVGDELAFAEPLFQEITLVHVIGNIHENPELLK